MTATAAPEQLPIVSSTVEGLPGLPVLVDARVTHRRVRPFPFAFSHRVGYWLIDANEPPRLPRLLGQFMSFRSQDHLGGGVRGGGLRGDAEAVLAERGISMDPEDRVFLLTSARSLGHVFNPLSVYWCVSPEGAVRATILEVHNTYGQRHVYVIGPDGDQEPIPKEFYVSPFNSVDGGYRVRARLTETGANVAIVLERDSEVIFAARLTGGVRPATRRSIVKRVLRSPLASYRVSALIRLHGIRLWFKRLPVQPRPAQHPEIF